MAAHQLNIFTISIRLIIIIIIPTKKKYHKNRLTAACFVSIYCLWCAFLPFSHPFSLTFFLLLFCVLSSYFFFLLVHHSQCTMYMFYSALFIICSLDGCTKALTHTLYTISIFNYRNNCLFLPFAITK